MAATPAAPSSHGGRRCRTGRARAGRSSGSGMRRTSWLDLAEDRHLAKEQAETRMEDLQREAEIAVGELGMGDVERAGAHPFGQKETAAEELEEIAGAAEDERAL